MGKAREPASYECLYFTRYLIYMNLIYSTALLFEFCKYQGTITFPFMKNRVLQDFDSRI